MMHCLTIFPLKNYVTRFNKKFFLGNPNGLLLSFNFKTEIKPIKNLRPFRCYENDKHFVINYKKNTK